MTSPFHTRSCLCRDLKSLGVRRGDGLFVHGSMRAIGSVIGGPRVVVEAILSSVGEDGLVGMPGFSSDASFPADMDRSNASPEQIARIEAAVPDYHELKSPTAGMGVIAETFRTWPGTRRSSHPTVSICLNGPDAERLLAEHSLAWATGPQTPLGKLRDFPRMKILLIGVGWNRCSALHTAETLADHRRTKTRRFKSEGAWIETPDVADDMNRLFPKVGAAFEDAGLASRGAIGDATCIICEYKSLVEFGTEWIDTANRTSGELT
ncbi:aminoglycoside N(3)-acetyltransferase [Roseovarius aquimarinus]|uniref:Aminoglycoside N(3)-acetyltransferase n=1 Tax=Roseovarius aquimarinus TaxID=1229156 RepID=A0ABW7I823_9RHOB